MNHLNEWTSSLKHLDYFKVSFNFRYRDYDAYRTRTGGLLFLFYLGFSILYISLTISDFVSGNVYTVSSSKTIVMPAPDIYPNKSNLFITVAFPNEEITSFLDMDMMMYSFTNDTKIPSSLTSIPLSRCIAEHYQGKIDLSSISELEISKAFCTHVDESIFLGGFFGSDHYSIFDLTITFKKGLLSSNDSKVVDSLYDFFDNNPFKVAIFWYDNNIDVDNFTYPVSGYIRYLVQSVDIFKYRMIDLYYSVVSFSSDNNMLYKKPIRNDFITFKEINMMDHIVPDRSHPSKLQNSLISFFLKSSPEMIIYDRVYQKLPEFLANLGGLQSNLLWLLTLLVGFFSDFNANLSIINKAFKFPLEKPIELTSKETKEIENIGSNRKNVSFKEIPKLIIRKESTPSGSCASLKSQVMRRSDLGDIIIEDNEFTNDFNSDRKINSHELILSKAEGGNDIKFAKKPLRFSSFDVIFRHFPCLKQHYSIREKLLEKANKKLSYYFDIFTYLRKIQEIDIIKFLLFDKDHLNLFRFVTRPQISHQKEDSDELFLKNQKNRQLLSKISQEDVKEILSSYNNLKGDSDEMTRKLFILFEGILSQMVK